MDDHSLLSLNEEEIVVLQGVEADLHRDGWARFVTASQNLRNWRDLADQLDRYDHGVDEYYNDLDGRKALELIVQRCPAPLGPRLRHLVDSADQAFRAVTIDEADVGLRVGWRTDGWWYHRVPRRGPLLEAQPEVAQRSLDEYRLPHPLIVCSAG